MYHTTFMIMYALVDTCLWFTDAIHEWNGGRYCSKFTWTLQIPKEQIAPSPSARSSQGFLHAKGEASIFHSSDRSSAARFRPWFCWKWLEIMVHVSLVTSMGGKTSSIYIYRYYRGFLLGLAGRASLDQRWKGFCSQKPLGNAGLFC